MKQLTLLEKFEKNEARQLELVELLGKEIGNLKYYRTCTAFSDFTPDERREITDVINNILHWVAYLAYYQSRGLEKFKKHNLASFLESTKDKVVLHQTHPHDCEITKEFYRNGFQRMRTLLMVNKDILTYRLKETKLILEHYNNLIKL